jgi:hypothetical protein
MGHGGEQRALFVYQIESHRYWQDFLRRDDFAMGQFGENLTVSEMPDDLLHLQVLDDHHAWFLAMVVVALCAASLLRRAYLAGVIARKSERRICRTATWICFAS